MQPSDWSTQLVVGGPKATDLPGSATTVGRGAIAGSQGWKQVATRGAACVAGAAVPAGRDGGGALVGAASLTGGAAVVGASVVVVVSTGSAAVDVDRSGGSVSASAAGDGLGSPPRAASATPPRSTT